MISPTIDRAVSSIVAPSATHEEAAQRRQNVLTKPTGSLGRLERMVIRLAGIQRTERPLIERGAVLLFAADHGVTAQGVSAYPREVTGQMVQNFLNGGAAVNVLGRSHGFDVRVVDVGVAADVPADPALVSARLGPGTDDLGEGPAMSREQAQHGIEIGIEQAGLTLDVGADAIVVGEMGIGSTTAAAAVSAVFTGRAPEELVGRGTGVDDAGLERKKAVVRDALARNRPEPADPLSVAAAVGGFEIVAAAGAMLGAAARGVPIVLDGFIVGAAALLAVRLVPAAGAYFFAGHRSTEPGHAAVLEALGLEPILQLEMRLGEGSGALVAVGVLRDACRLHAEMATFDEARVSDRGSAEG